MKTIQGVVNDLPTSLHPPKLKRGEVVRYQLLTGQPNPDAEQRKNNPIIFPFCNTVPARDRILDPQTGQAYDIALVESFDGRDKTVNTRPFVVFGKSTGGFFSVTGGIVADEELYAYAEITNYNESNPNRDPSVEPVFKRIDEQKDSKERVKKRNVKLEAMQYAANMTNGEIKDFAASMNWNDQLPADILKDKVGEHAEKFPEEFTKAVNNPDKDVKALLKRAIDGEKIRYDSAQHRIVLASNNQTLIKLDRIEGEDYLKQTADYILTNLKNGDKVLNTIKKLMSNDPS